MDSIGFIGSGNMAEALIRGIIAAGVVRPENIYISDVLENRLDELCEKYGVMRAQDNGALASTVGTIVLSVKPQLMQTVLEEIKTNVGQDTLVISIAAGRRVATITKALGDVAVIRVMPNTPALIGEGAAALYANKKAKGRLTQALKLFAAVGKTVVIENEDLMNAVTAVSGSGPAYYFLMMEEMIKAGIEMGLPADTAKELVLQTAKGAAMLALSADAEGGTPAELRRKVTSPGGTTQAAMESLAHSKFGQILATAIKQAQQRSRELSN